ncbi:MAG: YdcF family protein [Selenomonadaceae bacterium]
MAGITSLILAIGSSTNGIINALILFILYCVIPLGLLLISFVFITEGVIAIIRERFSLTHVLSIVFGLGIWSTFFAATTLFIRSDLSTITCCLLELTLIFAGYVIFTFSALFIYSQLYKILPKDKNCDYIIIHGAGLIDGKQVSPLLAGRIDKAIEVFKRSGQTAIIVASGGQGHDEKISEAQAMKNYLLEHGISPDHIILEDKSTTTLENMQFSKQILDKLKPNYQTIFVTNDYHVFRTGTYARKVGLKAEGVGCKTAFYYWSNAFIREYIAIMIKYKTAPIILFCFWIVLSVITLLPFNFLL